MIHGSTDTSEKGFQRLITRELQELHGYVASTSNEFDREFCLNTGQLLQFIEATQPITFQEIQKKGERIFLARLDSKIKEKGIIETLRRGVKFFDRTITLFYPQPNSSYNRKDQAKYEANIFSVTEELIYADNNKNRLDLVIFINGLPIITMELKNAFTQQAVKNAIRQYIKDRSAKDKLFHFARCMVHFAADTDEVYMSTTINGTNNFLPFNKGLNDGSPHPPFGAGNPAPKDKLKTWYLWHEVLAKSSLANIIEKFAQLVVEVDPKTKKSKKKLIFPRYHQLTVVRKLLVDAKEKGVGQRYLIQHSAGSGKSNSITWLAHQLVSLYDKTNTQPLFDCVVVVTDRTVLDKQIKTNIKSFSHVKKVVEAITGSAKDIKELDPTETSFSKTTHMRLALANNKKLMICTVQTFPFVLNAVQDMQEKRVAIIIDEAHSSQSGQAAASLNALFASNQLAELPKDEEGAISTEDLLNYLIQSRKMLANASYFAFTATPKNKTLETFGIPQEYTDENGEVHKKYIPFHTYSMKQAIDEEFILDVLEKYTTYQSYYKI
ncbi:type I restriction endonuclease [Marinoscillum furvescens]|uniref:Type III restriction/modification enzyme restriction subunit n=1 Tax=Marinoscillum furvescens DSM 4134 TaxID=1122208 RepID=A0A3D9L1Q4_MARFU|nr:type I restriction endonuclease [Marinoscillum furvescens]RED94643.1 type III restriction/modification enzyme restriction subunit [Marinoscillum furvescens DSM 4134]